jgi:hypothetical protein
MRKKLEIDIKTDDDGAIRKVIYLDLATKKKKILKKFTHPKGAPPPGVAQPDEDIKMREYKGGMPSHYCVIDPTTGNLWCIDIP